MTRFFDRYRRLLAKITACLFCSAMFAVTIPAPGDSGAAFAAGNGLNVIIMIGDGMGWNMARAGAIAKGGQFYTAGKGAGLNMQTLSGYAVATTYGTTVKGANGVFGNGLSALDGSNPATGASPVRPGFVFNPAFNPGTPPAPLKGFATRGTPCATGGATSGGNLVGYNPALGGPMPWIPLTPANPGSYNVEYIKCSYPDSANTASNLYTGVKSYNNAMSVDLFEKANQTILQAAALKGKSTGVVTSVPITHATPGAAVSSVNRRNKYDADFPLLDNILQEAIRSDFVATLNPPAAPQGYLPTVMLGGGHPLDFQNAGATGPIYGYTYIKQSTYTELSTKPTSNRYGYRFLERGPNAASTLLSTADSINPNNGGRLLGLYGARGQNGNLPVSSANGDYSLTGLDNFSVNSSVNSGTGLPNPDKVRPLSPGETDATFIAREVNENPTLSDLSLAALKVLGKDPDGFWLMIEGGDVDWAAHDNNMDNLIGTVKDFDRAVGTVISWINNNGGWQKNVLIVTADHDHYLTLNSNFPQLLASASGSDIRNGNSIAGAEALTYATNAQTANAAGHFWGSDDQYKYGWGSHGNRPVPVYYQGAPLNLNQFVSQGYTNYGFNIPGVPGMIDQVHIYKAMLDVINK